MSGNGVDIGAVYGLLSQVAEGVATLQKQVVLLQGQVAVLQRDMVEVKRELSKKADRDEVASLRQAVTGYHASVMGHGILISEPDARVSRIERRLELGAPT